MKKKCSIRKVRKQSIVTSEMRMRITRAARRIVSVEVEKCLAEFAVLMQLTREEWRTTSMGYSDKIDRAILSMKVDLASTLKSVAFGLTNPPVDPRRIDVRVKSGGS